MTEMEQERILCLVELTDAIDDNNMVKAQTFLPRLNNSFGTTYYKSDLFGRVTTDNANRTFAYVLMNGTPFTETPHMGEALKKLTDIMIISPNNGFISYQDIINFVDDHKNVLPLLNYDDVTGLMRQVPQGALKDRLFNIIREIFGTSEE